MCDEKGSKEKGTPQFIVSVNKKWILYDETEAMDNPKLVKGDMLDEIRLDGIRKKDIEVKKIGKDLSKEEAKMLYHLRKAQRFLCEMGMETS